MMQELYTIQFEEYHKGTDTYFIRIEGFNLGCHYCKLKGSCHKLA